MSSARASLSAAEPTTTQVADRAGRQRAPQVAPSAAAARRWRLATAAFATFLAAIISSASLGYPLPILAWVRYLPGGDFTGHAVLVGTMAFFAGGCAPRLLGRWISTGAAVVALLIAGEELSQIWLESRAFSLGDLAGNALGIVVAEIARRRFLGS
ncbi:MAG: hypothetical protein AAGM22_27430 [Acidobacteriota bacterium]